MTPAFHVLRQSHPTTPGVVRIVREAVAEYARDAGFRGKRLDAVQLAVSEAVTNVVVHAYPTGDGEVHLNAAASSDELCVRISDDGVGCNAPARKPGLGLGLGLIADATDEFILEQRARGTTAVMRFKLDT